MKNFFNTPKARQDLSHISHYRDKEGTASCLFYLWRKIPELDERLHFHDLRKSCISNLSLKGYSLKEVQKWVGQEDVETTMRIYNKVRQQDKERISSGQNVAFFNMLSMPEKRENTG